ncbi:DELLA protein RGL1-like [Primulina tabacum]|uniref:DELLA protein RGL1-like n=1 Tax=Primulina tabacum TaxID=48773 RepID=UPI003F594123
MNRGVAERRFAAEFEGVFVGRPSIRCSPIFHRMSKFTEAEGLDQYGLSTSPEILAEQNGLWGGDQEQGESCMDVDLFGYDTGFEYDTAYSALPISKSHSYQPMQRYEDFVSSDNLSPDVVWPRNLSHGNEFRNVVRKDNLERIEHEKKGPFLFHSASFEILKRYGSRCRKLDGEKMNDAEPRKGNDPTPMSTETIIRLAAERFIQSTSQSGDEISILSHPYPSSILCHSAKDSEGVQLVQNLLSCAEKVGEQKYECARKLLEECDRLGSSRAGSPVQRLVFYFTEALHERIDRETGRVTPKGLGKKFEAPLEALTTPNNSALIAFHNNLPLSQVTKFAGIQAILDHASEAGKIHVIDFEIRTGLHFTILMQALAVRCKHPLELLKVTAVGTRSKKTLEEASRRLTNFADSLNLKFSFNVVMVADILDLVPTMFELDAEEKVAIFAAYTFTGMIVQPDRLEHLMRVFRTINPCVMVIAEAEGNCNSPIFVDRFVDSLFFYCAYFESMAACLKDDEKNRAFAESDCFGSSIRNIVACEGEERKIRHVCIGVWRTFFASFGLEELELSMSSLYQANLVLKSFACGDSFTLDTDGKSLIIGWKGTPLSSLSAWKFHSVM